MDTTANRREFLRGLRGAASWATAGCLSAAQKPDIDLRIGEAEIELAPGRKVKTTVYNGAVPGPILRVAEGRRITAKVSNETRIPELVHWHGLFVPSDVDGAMEEGTPMIPPHGVRSYTFVPRPAGTRWYHTHIPAKRDLKRSTYTGQFGFLYVEPKSEPGQYDAEIFLALHGWDPYFGTGGNEDAGLEVIYKHFSINGRALGHGEPVRVREGQRVLFRILNAGATLTHRIALAGHKLTVIALDGNPVPSPRAVEMLEMGPAERIDAVATMDRPGVWIFGELDDHIRTRGSGIVVEYANRTGPPQWIKPDSTAWDYTIFGSVGGSRADAEIVPLVFREKFAGNRWVDHWTINGKEYPRTDPILVRRNQRYRLRFDNQSDEAHPVHLHRHTFELARVAGKATAGVKKDVVVVPARRQVEAEFVADNPGPTLFHCHQQMHMDFGFMTMLRYRD